MKINMTLTAAMLSAMLGTSLHAATWYADASMPDDSGDGTSAATAKKYIQSAVALANMDRDAEVTVLVAPGDYSEGAAVADSNGANNRVCITNKMTLASTHGKAVTFIAGALGSGDYGLGAGSIRAVCVQGEAARGTRIKGFTFRDSAASSGGAVYFNQSTCDVYVLDCTATNCAANYGGGMSGVVAIRSLIVGCHNNNSGLKGAALYNSKAYNCIFASCGNSDSDKEYILQGNGPYINCTAVANNGSLLRTSASQEIYNLISTLACRQEFDGTNKGGPKCIQEWSNGLDNTSSTKLAPSKTSKYVTLLVSPLTGDYRPVSNATGGTAEGYGSTTYLSGEYLWFVPEEERGTDYFGNPRVVNDSVDAGAIQGAVTLSGGRVIVSETIPTPAQPTSTEYTRLMYANADNVASEVYIQQPEGAFASTIVTNQASFNRFADAKGGFWQMLPPSGYYVEITNILATAVLTVSPSSQYQTIQEAVDAAAADGYTVINVAPGTYATGGSSSYGSMAARVAIDGSKNIFIRSTTGKAEDVVIRGEYNSEEATCGEDAVRCVTVSAGSGIIGISGVTFSGGASGAGTASNYEDDVDWAGGLYVVGSSLSALRRVQVLDSVFADNRGRNGSAACGGWLQRCRLYGNSNDIKGDRNDGISCVVKGIMSSCVMLENSVKGNQLMANFEMAYNCTVYGNSAEGDRQPFLGKNAVAYGCILYGGQIDKEATSSDSIVWNLSTNALTGGYVEADPHFANVPKRNFALWSESPAIAAVAPANITDFWKYSVGDVNNRPLSVSADGKVTAGAFQVAYEPITAYVDAVGGDDANDGLSAETAKQTLAAVLDLASGYGDTVYAAAGTYASGSALQPERILAGTPTIPARGLVYPGVTLAGAGATNTFIRGGENVRCLVVGAGAAVSGFTIADGQVVTNSSSMSDNTVGGGILAEDDSSTVISDCVISNNFASFGGAARGGTYSRCVFACNTSYRESGTATGAATMNNATLRNCLFHGNKAQKIIDDYDGVYNCTFLYDNTRVNGNRLSSFGTYRADSAAPLVNSVFLLAPTDSGESVRRAAVYAAVNCFFPRIKGTTWYWILPEEGSSGNITNDVEVASNNPGLTDATVWAKRRAITVDVGATAYVPEDDTDLAGNPRISNGIVDIGCYEWQWEQPMGLIISVW